MQDHRQEIRGAINVVQTCMHPNGTIALTSGVRTALLRDPQSVLLCLDARNAFGTIERPAIANGLREIGLGRFMGIFNQIYGGNNQLLVQTSTGPQTIDVTRGVLQGETLSSFFFCAGLQPVLKAVRQMGLAMASPVATDPTTALLATEYHAHPAAFADDSYLLGRLAKVEQLAEAFIPMLATIGLDINKAKSTLACASDATKVEAEAFAALHGYKYVSLETDAIIVLGIPIGSKDGIKAILRDKIKQLEYELSRINWLQDKQTAMLLLRYCGVHKANHLLRSVQPSVIAEYCKIHDEGVQYLLGTHGPAQPT